MRQSVWLDAETTPVDKKRANSCVWKYFLFWGSSANKKSAIKPWKCFLRRATKVTFCGWCCRRNPRSTLFFETALRAVIIDQLIWGQTSWEVVLVCQQVSTNSTWRGVSAMVVRKLMVDLSDTATQCFGADFSTCYSKASATLLWAAFRWCNGYLSCRWSILSCRSEILSTK